MAPDRQDPNAAWPWAGPREPGRAGRSCLVAGLGGHAAVHRHLMRALGQPRAPLQVGDADCRVGERCRLWAASGHRVYGAAAHPGQVALARRAAFGSGIEIVFDVATAAALPWPNRCMDLVFAPALDENDAQAWACIDELARVLKPGAILVLAWPTPYRLHAALALRLGLAAPQRRFSLPAAPAHLLVSIKAAD